MDAVVQLDSRSWVFNRYDIGSMSNVRVRDGDAGSEAQGDYTYNGGTPGWVRVRFSGEDIQCIEYHDFAGTCRAIGDNPARRAAIMGMISVAGAAMTSSPGSSHGSDGDHALEHQINQRRQCLAAGGGTAC